MSFPLFFCLKPVYMVTGEAQNCGNMRCFRDGFSAAVG